MLKTIFALTLLVGTIASATPLAVSGHGSFSYDRHSGGTEFFAYGESFRVFGDMWMTYPRTDHVWAESPGSFSDRMYIVYGGYFSRYFFVGIGGGSGFVRIYDHDTGRTLLHDLALIGWVSRTFYEPRLPNEVWGTLTISPTSIATTSADVVEQPEPGAIAMLSIGAALLYAYRLVRAHCHHRSDTV